MGGVRDRHPERALNTHSKEDLIPDESGPVNFAFGKEGLLILYTTMRNVNKQSIIDYIFKEGKNRNAGFFTTSHVLAEVMGTVRSNDDSEGVCKFRNAVEASNIYVLHGSQPWENPYSGINEKKIYENVMDLYNTYPTINFKFHEGTLVLDAARLQAERESETTYVVSLDGDLTNLAWCEGLNVLPNKTKHRNDQTASD